MHAIPTLRWVLVSALLASMSSASLANPQDARFARFGLEADTDRPGADFKQLRLDDPVQCHLACKKDPRCTAFTHHARVCYLKDGETEAQRKAGHVSGTIADKPDPAALAEQSRQPERTSFNVPRLPGSLATRRHEAQPPTQWLDLRQSESAFVRVTDRDDVLGTGVEGAISAWLQADWDDATCQAEEARLGSERWMTVYDHGSTTRGRYRVFVACDRERVFIQNGAAGGGDWDEAYLPGDGLRDGKAHQLHLRVNATGTEIWLDDEFAGAVGIGFAAAPSAPLAIGSMNARHSHFPGRIGRVRVFASDIDEKRLRIVGGMDDELARKQPEWASVVAYLEHESDGRPVVTLKEAAWDPAVVAHGRPFMRSGDERITQPRFQASSEANLTYRPRPIHSLFWTDVCALPMGAPSPSDRGCGTQVLVMATVSHDVSSQSIRYRLFERTGDERFREIGGSLSLQPGSRAVDMRVGNEIYALAGVPLKDSDYGSAWVGGGETNMDFASKGFHLQRLDPFDVSNNGADSFVFGMSASYMNHYRPFAWRKVAGMTTPWGLDLDKEKMGCSGGRETKTVTNERELAETAGNNWSMTIMNFSVNESFKRSSNEMSREEKTRISAQARCNSYALVLDRGRAVLDAGFRSAVELTAEACTAGSGCERSIRDLVDRFGTHYPNAIGYGGVAEMQADLTSSETRLVRTLEKTRGMGFEMDVTTSITADAIVAEVSASTSWRNGFNFQEMSQQSATQAMKEINEKMRFETRGGRGGSTFEAWTSDDTAVVPIYADIRPLPELLAPPFFTDREVVDVVRPALQNYLEQLLELNELKTEQFNTQPPFTAKRTAGFEYGYDRPGGDYRRASTTSPEQCRDVCKRDGACNTFTFGNGTCYLKKGTPNKVLREGLISAVVRKPAATPAPPPEPKPQTRTAQRWTGWVSEEGGSPVANCPNNEAMVGIGCRGDNCDDLQLLCGKAPFRVGGGDAWSGWYSEESGRNRFQAGPGYVITAMRCRGSDCDDVNMHVRRVDATLRACRWTDSWVSEEMGQMTVPTDSYVTGIECSGSRCDNKKLRYCQAMK